MYIDNSCLPFPGLSVLHHQLLLLQWFGILLVFKLRWMQTQIGHKAAFPDLQPEKTSFQRCFLLNKQMGTTCFSQSLPQTMNYDFPSQISIRGSLKLLTAIKSCYCLYLLQIAYWNKTRVFSLDYALPKALDYFVWLDPLFITKKIMVLNNKEFLDSWGVQIFNYFAKNFRTEGSW